MLRFLVRR